MLSSATLGLVPKIMVRNVSGGSKRRILSCAGGDTTKLSTTNSVYDEVGLGLVRIDLASNGPFAKDLMAGIAAAKMAKNATEEKLLTDALNELTEAAEDNVTNPPPWDAVLVAARISVIRLK